MQSKASAVIQGILRRCFKPKEHTPPSEWVEKFIRLDAKTSNIAGRYSLRHTPYLRQIYDDVANPRIRKIVLKKSAQIGATQFANNVLLYYVANHTFPLLMIMPSKEAAQQFCERSLTPSIFGSSEVKKFLTDNQDDVKKTEMLFTSCILRCIGAGSPSKLASNPACLVVIDESDKLETFESIHEAPALELAEDRTISFPNDKKIIVMSTPTTENTSVVHSEYLKGSQSRYFVPCPHCDHEQVLDFRQIKWNECKLEDGSYDLDRVEANTYYECANDSCKAHLTEQDKVSMVRAGQWKDTNPKPFPSEIRSYHISALYSFNITWGGMAKLFLLSKSDIGKLRNFYNSYLGEVFSHQATTIKVEQIDKLIEESPKYQKGELISKPICIIMAADTQGAEFWYGMQAVYKDGSSHVIDWGSCATFEDLALIYRRTYPIRGTEERAGIFRCLIDSGYKTDMVYRFCVASGFKFIPIKGVASRTTMFQMVNETTLDYQGLRLKVLLIQDDYFKTQLYISGIKERSLKLYLPQDSDMTLKLQLCSEHLVDKKIGGITKQVWRCANRNNHLGDVMKYLEAFKMRIAPELELASKVQTPPATETNVTTGREYVLRNGTYDGGGWD